MDAIAESGIEKGFLSEDSVPTPTPGPAKGRSTGTKRSVRRAALPKGKDSGRATRKIAKAADIHGVAHIKSSFNNTMITVTDNGGNVITWASGGTTGVRGTRKGTAFAASQAAVQAAERALEAGIRKMEIWVRGPGSGREAAVRALQSTDLEVTGIKDLTKVPHNGSRLSKRRRGK